MLTAIEKEAAHPPENPEVLSSPRRWILLITFTLQTVLTGCVYFGWAPLASMLLSAGVFSTKCPTDANGNFLEDRRLEGEAFICNEQDAAVQHLYAITLAVHFTTSAFAGLMMDTLGPKYTSVLGQSFNVAGWLCLSSVSSQSHSTVYAAFVLIGMGADTAFLPTLLVSRLFPRSAGLVITLLGAACSASFVVPLVLWSLLPTGDLSGCVWYAGVGPGLFAVVDAFLMPLRPFKPAEGAPEERILPEVSSVREVDSFLARPERHAHRSSPELLVLSTDSSTPGNPPVGGTSSSIFRTIISERYALVVLYFIGVSWVSSFYQEAHNRLLAFGPQRFLGFMLPMSFIPCIILGKVSDRVGILPVMLTVNAAGVLAYLCSLSQDPAAGYASVLFFMIYMSLFSSQVFIYVEETFAPQHFGRLVGLVELIGGMLSLLCNPVYAHAVASEDGGGVFRVQILVLLLLLAEFVVVGRLIFLGSPNMSSRSFELSPVASSLPQDDA